MTEDRPLVVEDRGAARWIWFNRPAVHNAQNVAMLQDLEDALREVERSPEVRVLVLAGRGPSFCSGHDLREMGANPEYAANASTVEGRYWQELRLFVRPVEILRDLPIPTIARVHGYCLAAGLMFVSATDLVVASDDAVFGSPIIPALAVNDAEVPGWSWLLGERRAKQMLWLGERIDAAEAHELGVVNWVVDQEALDAKVTVVADQLIDVPREVLALSKSGFAFMANRQGRQDFSDFHYLAHQLSHHTTEAEHALSKRLERIASGQSPVADRHRDEGP